MLFRSVFLKNNINAKKHLNFCKKNNFQIEINTVELQFDDTLFGSGDNGFLISNNKIYWSNFTENPGELELSKIEKITAEDDSSFEITSNTGEQFSIKTTIIKKSILISSVLSACLNK